MNKIGLFYGPARGSSTERVAKKVADQIGREHVDLVAVKEAKASDLEKYDNLIFGVSTIGRETWDGTTTASDWDQFRPELDKANLNGKTVAMFSLGDHVTYPRHFVDALGQLYEIIKDQEIKLVGHVDPDGYEFEESEGIYDGNFIGLPIDEDYESHLTDERIKNWTDRIRKEFK
jgi:flavodoxin I